MVVLHRSRTLLAYSLSALVAAGCLVTFTAAYAIGLGFALVGVLLLGYAVRPFRFTIGPDGLDVRHRGLARRLRWDEIAEIAYALPEDASPKDRPRLVLVPAPGVALGVSLDAGEGRVVLSLDDVRESRERILSALAEYGRERFVDRMVGRVGRLVIPQLTVAAYGYDQPTVDALIRAAGDALADPSPRVIKAWNELNAFLSDPVVGPNGYDPAEADAFLRNAADELAARIGQKLPLPKARQDEPDGPVRS